ncbi:MAG: hypothetical protein GXO55_07190 [Chloroflexi bacterium]|nr:hypothetical protein [Chloroflexota bacterium]
MMKRVYHILTTVRNQTLTLTLHTDGTWSLHTRTGPPARISRAHWRVRLTDAQGHTTLTLSSLRHPVERMEEEELPTLLGPARVITLYHQPDPEGNRLLWRAYVFQEHPYLAVATGVHLTSPGWRVHELVPLAVEPPRGYILIEGVGPQWTFFVEGWHTHSFSGVLADNQRHPQPRWPHLDALLLHDPIHPPPKAPGHFLSHTWGVLTGLTSEPTSLVLAWMRQHRFAGFVEIRRNQAADPHLWAWMDGEGIAPDADSPLWTAPLLIHIVPPRTPDPLTPAAHAMSVWNQVQLPEDQPVLWTTEHALAAPLRPDDILRQAHRLRDKREDLPTDIVHVGEGYERVFGDWLDLTPPFQDRMAALVHSLEDAGFDAGLWLSPFLVSPKSGLARTHPDWLLTGEDGRPLTLFRADGGPYHPLDTTHPEVEAYLQELVQTVVHKWGYRLLTLDDVYAAALPGRRHRGHLTRIEAYRHILARLRDAAGPEVRFIGRGALLGPSAGLFHALQTGPEMAPHWHPKRWRIPWPGGDRVARPAAINAIRGALTRSPYNGHLWHNLPGCILLADTAGDLLPHEIQSWITVVGLTRGSIAYSVRHLDEEQQQWLAALLPVQPEQGHPLDLLEHTIPETIALYMEREWGKGVTVGLFNWRDELRTRTLQLGTLGLDWRHPHHVLDFWHRRYYRVTQGYRVFTNIPPHGGHLLGVKPVQEIPHLAGSTFHITQGGEVKRWQWAPPYLTVRVELGRRARGTLLLGLAGYALVHVPADVQVEYVSEDVVGLTLEVRGEREFTLELAEPGR